MANFHVIFGILMFLVVSREPKLILTSAAPSEPSTHVQNAPLVEFFYWNVDPFFHIPNYNPDNIHGNIIVGLFIYNILHNLW